MAISHNTRERRHSMKLDSNKFKTDEEGSSFLKKKTKNGALDNYPLELPVTRYHRCQE